MDEKERYSNDLLVALAERTIKRLWVLIILLIVLLFGTNAAWIFCYEPQVDKPPIAAEETTNIIDIAADGTGQGV